MFCAYFDSLNGIAYIIFKNLFVLEKKLGNWCINSSWLYFTILLYLYLYHFHLPLDCACLDNIMCVWMQLIKNVYFIQTFHLHVVFTFIIKEENCAFSFKFYNPPTKVFWKKKIFNQFWRGTNKGITN